jgi:hypothetical protein
MQFKIPVQFCGTDHEDRANTMDGMQLDETTIWEVAGLHIKVETHVPVKPGSVFKTCSTCYDLQAQLHRQAC